VRDRPYCFPNGFVAGGYLLGSCSGFIINFRMDLSAQFVLAIGYDPKLVVG
jgi:hypothetical protein